MTYNSNSICPTYFQKVDSIRNLKHSTNRIELFLEKKNQHLNLAVYNNSKDSIFVSIEDARLYVILEALSPENEWKPIEYFQRSSCGNSLSSKYIDSSSAISTQSEFHTGRFRTKIRYKILLGLENYYSNEVACSIDLNLFNISSEALKHSKYYNHLGQKIALGFIFLDSDSTKKYMNKILSWREKK
ncbi:MAG: hypothetical protein EOO51_13285 [Flavobacterium sp.]|nr:MAG: hypothetical protein EOO51_13285 [Flavobacterium sp.]